MRRGLPTDGESVKPVRYPSPALGLLGVYALMGLLACQWTRRAAPSLTLVPTPTEFPFPTGPNNAAGIIPGLTTFEQVKLRFGEPISAGAGVEAWWFNDIALEDSLASQYQATLVVFVQDRVVSEFQIIFPPTSTLTAETVVTSYGPPAYVELASPQPNTELPAWSALLYPQYGVFFELQCSASIDEGCHQVKKSDRVGRIDFFLPKSTHAFLDQLEANFPSGSWFDIILWPGFKEN